MILLDSYVIIIWNPSDSILSVSHEFERNKADIIKKGGAFLPISDARRGNFEKWYVSCDYGTVNPTSMGLWGLHEGIWYRVKEFYFNSREKQKQMTDEEYAAELKKIDERFVPFLNICKANNTAVRIGVNHGSLSDRIMSRYGDTPEGIVESCMEFLRICKR